jgi:hypothetical protein
MKRLIFAMMALIIAMTMPVLATAMDHSAQGKDMADDMKQHGDMAHEDQGKHKGHDMKMDKADDKAHDMHQGHDMGSKNDDFVEIGKDTQEGVVATAKVKTYDKETMATMAKMGMTATHHVMVFFADEKTGEAVASGKAALKIKGGDAKPAMLMQMGTGFGGDVTVGEGMATFEIGTKLEDGKKRQFSIMFHNM